MPRLVQRVVQRTASSDQIQREPDSLSPPVVPDVVSRYSSGLVDTLPVTGIGGLMEVARTATGPYFGTSPTSGAGDLGDRAGRGHRPVRLAGHRSRRDGPRPAGCPDLRPGRITKLARTGAGAQASPYAGQTDSAVSRRSPGARRRGRRRRRIGRHARSGIDRSGSGYNAPGGVADLDRLLEALEDTVLRELERRGGRFEGVF